MTNPTEPEVLDRRLSTYEYISHAADVGYFNGLVNLVRGMEKSGERFDIPSYREPYAWKRTFEIYSRLKRREMAPTDPGVIAAQNRIVQNNAAWSKYLQQRELLLSLIGSHGVTNRDLMEYLELTGDDLASPTSEYTKNDCFSGGPREYWWRRAHSIDAALGRLGTMNAVERSSISRVMASRRMAARASDLAQRVTALEDKQSDTERME